MKYLLHFLEKKVYFCAVFNQLNKNRMKKLSIFCVCALSLFCACTRQTETDEMIMNFVKEKIDNEKVKVEFVESELIDSITSEQVLDYRIERFNENLAFDQERRDYYATSEFLQSDTSEYDKRIAIDKMSIEWCEQAKLRDDRNLAVSKCYRVKYHIDSELLEKDVEQFFWVDGQETRVLLCQNEFDRLKNSIGHAAGYLDFLDSIEK